MRAGVEAVVLGGEVALEIHRHPRVGLVLGVIVLTIMTGALHKPSRAAMLCMTNRGEGGDDAVGGVGIGVGTCAAVCRQVMQHSLLVERLLECKDLSTLDHDRKGTL